jgi:hypothetical protein
LKSFLVKKYIQLLSWKTNEQIVVFESDDWGTERTRDKEALKHLLAIHPDIEKDRFTRLDSIASEDDLSFLFEVLTSVKDGNGCYAKLTANVCTANPDFNKIAASGYSDFFYEPFYETILRRPNGKRVLDIWSEGIEKKVFIPQLHGREHVHALAWLEELRNGNDLLLKAFPHNSWGIPYKATGKQKRKNVMASLDIYGLKGEDVYQQEWIIESSAMFEQYFGYASKTFIPPAYTWHSRIFSTLQSAKVEAVQGISLQYQPEEGSTKNYKRRLHINGTKGGHNIVRLARNSFFEPASAPDKDWVDRCLSGVKNAFANHQPAIIGSHRINFIGSLDSSNRDANLKSLSQLLNNLIKHFPGLVFMSSDELLEKMKQS